MTITATLVQSNVALNFAHGAHLDDAATPALKAITVGFRPSYVKYLDATNRLTWEWYDGMANGTSLKTAAAGSRTLDTGDVAISIADTAAESSYITSAYKPVLEKGTFVVTVAAACITQSAQGYFEIRE